MDSDHAGFEEFCKKINLGTNSVWKSELNRYTLLSIKQLLWETWNAAKGIDYVYKSGNK